MKRLEEEISLREIIEVMLNFKWVIAAVTAAVIALSGIYSFFILQPVYEAGAVILIRQPSDSIDLDRDLIDVVEALSRETFDLERYKLQVRSHALMEQVIQELDLPFTPATLSRSINVGRIDNTNMLTISFTNQDPELAATVINTLTNKFLNFISEQKFEEIAISTAFILQQKNITEENLSEALEKMKLLLQEPNSVAELDAEIKAKIALLTNYKSEIISARVDLAASRKERDSLKRQLEAAPTVLTTKKSVATDPYVASILTGVTGESIVEIGSLEFTAEEVNPVHVFLTQELANMNIKIDRQQEEIASMEDAVKTLEGELESLQIVFAEKKISHDDLQRQVDIHKSNLLAISDRYTAARMSESIQAGNLSMSVVSSAIPPESPSGPNKKLNMAIGAALGLMLGVLVAFFAHYWKNSGKQQELSENSAS